MKPYAIPSAWATAIERWTLALHVAGRSDQTIETRTEHMRRLARASKVGAPSLLSRGKLERWVGEQDWAAETRRSHYASIRGFYRWYAGVEQADDISDCLPPILPAAPCPRPAGEVVYREAVSAADDRARIILRLAGEAGLRRGEIAKIGANDLLEDLTGWSLVVHGKGSKTRLVPLSDSLASEIRAFLGRRAWLLPNRNGEPMTARHVGKIASRALPEGTTLHMLRHRFSARVNERTRDLRSLQVILGHASLATTERYVPVDVQALRDAVAAAS